MLRVRLLISNAFNGLERFKNVVVVLFFRDSFIAMVDTETLRKSMGFFLAAFNIRKMAHQYKV